MQLQWQIRNRDWEKEREREKIREKEKGKHVLKFKFYRLVKQKEILTINLLWKCTLEKMLSIKKAF